MKAVKNMGRGMVERYGDRPGRDLDQPAFTIRASAGGMEPGGFVWDGVNEGLTARPRPSLKDERSNMDHSSHTVLDLFAGTGVGVALKQLGVKEFGVELMPEAVATREANGMETVYHDVWDAHLADGLEFDTLWASPPCQTFSMAGNGAGRRALDDVLGVIERGEYKDMGVLREQAALLGDERIGLVLTPLHYVHRFRPTYIALEQVPPVLPVWQAMAEVLRSWGYSAWAGLLHAEQYGVPQTRKRAFLMARADGVEVAPPVPTHSKYYPRTPEKLDPGVKKWVSMADALGWASPESRPAPTVTGGGAATGGAEPFGMAARDALRRARNEEQLWDGRRPAEAGRAA